MSSVAELSRAGSHVALVVDLVVAVIQKLSLPDPLVRADLEALQVDRADSVAVSEVGLMVEEAGAVSEEVFKIEEGTVGEEEALATKAVQDSRDMVVTVVVAVAATAVVMVAMHHLMLLLVPEVAALVRLQVGMGAAATAHQALRIEMVPHQLESRHHLEVGMIHVDRMMKELPVVIVAATVVATAATVAEILVVVAAVTWSR